MTELQAFAIQVLSFPGLQWESLARMAHVPLDLRAIACHFLFTKSVPNLLSLSIIFCDHRLSSVNFAHCRSIG